MVLEFYKYTNICGKEGMKNTTANNPNLLLASTNKTNLSEAPPKLFKYKLMLHYHRRF